MYKMVLNDYRYHWKACLKNIPPTIGSALALLVVWRDEINLALPAFAFILAIIISRMYSGTIDKTLLLCPLTKEERENYGKTGFVIRALICIAIAAIAHIILFTQKSHPIASYAFTFIAAIISSLYINIYYQPIVNISNYTTKSDPMQDSYTLWNMFAQCSMYLILIINAFFETSDSLLLIAGLNVPLILFQIFVLVNMYKKFFAYCLDTTTYYTKGERYENNN